MDAWRTRNIGWLHGRAPVLVAVLAIVAVAFVIGSDSAHASSFVVDTTSDANLTACTVAANDCSLRGAINNAVANSGADTITFDANIAANSVTSPDSTFSGYHSIALDSSGNPVVSYY